MSRMSISYILVAECPIVKCCPMSAATSWSMTGTETSNIIMSCPAPSARSAWQMTASTLSPHGLLENCCTLCSPAGKHKNDPTRRAFRRAVLLIGNQTFMKKVLIAASAAIILAAGAVTCWTMYSGSEYELFIIANS